MKDLNPVAYLFGDDTPVRKEELSAGKMLVELVKYGEPRVFYCKGHSMGWGAAVDLNTDHVGLEGTVRSGFRHPTPEAALLELLERVRGLSLSKL